MTRAKETVRVVRAGAWGWFSVGAVSTTGLTIDGAWWWAALLIDTAYGHACVMDSRVASKYPCQQGAMHDSCHSASTSLRPMASITARLRASAVCPAQQLSGRLVLSVLTVLSSLWHWSLGPTMLEGQTGWPDRLADCAVSQKGVCPVPRLPSRT